MGHLHFAAITALTLTLLGCSRTSTHGMREEILDQRFVHKYGVDVPPEFWESSGEDGTVVSTLANGVVVSKAYKGGVLDGETTFSFPHSSQLQKKEIYSQGTLTRVIELHIEGTPRNEIVYDSPEPGVQTISTWYISGAPKSVERLNSLRLISGEYFNSTNQQDGAVENGVGTRLIRDDYGQLISIDTIDNGMLIMRHTNHPNNSPRERIPYQNNCIHGCKQTFLPAGEPHTIEQWVKGRQEGISVVFFHGEKYAEIPYTNGVKQGIEKRYRDGNQLFQEVSWQNDQLHGPSITYVGETTKTDWYYQGVQTTEANYQFMSNRPMVR